MRNYPNAEVVYKIQKGNCKVCNRNLEGNFGGINGMCSYCLDTAQIHSDSVRCPRCRHTWRYLYFNDRHIPDYYDKVRDGRLGQTIKCSQCGWSKHRAIYWRRYNKTPHRAEYIRNYRAAGAGCSEASGQKE